MAIRFKEGDVRTTGRATEGVRGLDLAEGDVVVGMVVVREDSTLLVVSEKGMGKRTAVDAYRMQRRGGKGVINLRISKKTGKVVSIKSVRDEEQLMLITRKGVVNRQSVGEINVIGRATQGVKLMNLDEGDQVVDVAWVIIGDEEEEDEAVEAAVQIAEEQAAAERAGARTPRSLGRDEDEDELDDDELDGDGDDLEDDFEDEDFGDDGLDDEDDA
jgi:DNA gyrase subunit A